MTQPAKLLSAQHFAWSEIDTALGCVVPSPQRKLHAF
jgi:hypothetical protein